MSTFEMLTIIGSILIPMMAGFAWVITRMDKKFELVDRKFEIVDNKIEKICQILLDMNTRLTRLEVRVEERTLKVVHVEKKANE